MTAPYRSLGRQVLRGETHIALAANDALARKIAGALNDTDHMDAPIMPELRERGGGLVSHQWTRQGDEYACSCSKRWPISDGFDHP